MVELWHMATDSCIPGMRFCKSCPIFWQGLCSSGIWDTTQLLPCDAAMLHSVLAVKTVPNAVSCGACRWTL